MKNKVIVIAGPTASGKSSLAVDVAVAFSGRVINADSMQVYRELDILTARPPLDDLQRAPHRLYGEMGAAEACSVGRWLKLAVAEIESTWREGELPIVVGGTGLYLKALLEGLSHMPDVPASARNESIQLHEKLGGEKFREELAKRDPVSADRIPANDKQRLTRAYEVAIGTGRALSDWQKENPPGPPLDAEFAVIVLKPEREALYDSINVRFDRMVELGALEEVRRLSEMSLDPNLPAMKALGVKELKAYLDGETDIDEALESAKRTTRQFAKRQLTWFRNQISSDLELPAQYSESLRSEIFSFIRHFVLTRRL